MKNVFARTVLALVLIPSFWMTSVGMAAAEWVEAPGETVGKMAECHQGYDDEGPSGHENCQNPLPVTDTFFGFLLACSQPLSTRCRASEYAAGRGMCPNYIQFVPDYSATNTALSGKCYFYEAGSSSGESGPHTWRWDE